MEYLSFNHKAKDIFTRAMGKKLDSDVSEVYAAFKRTFLTFVNLEIAFLKDYVFNVEFTSSNGDWPYRFDFEMQFYNSNNGYEFLEYLNIRVFCSNQDNLAADHQIYGGWMNDYNSALDMFNDFEKTVIFRLMPHCEVKKVEVDASEV